MSNKDTIYRQAAIDGLGNLRMIDTYDEDGDCFLKVRASDVHEMLKALPSAQPEIIRCGDCKYYKSVLAHCTIRGDKAFLIRGANDYCSRAERREE